jgi:hypothetical protein
MITPNAKYESAHLEKYNKLKKLLKFMYRNLKVQRTFQVVKIHSSFKIIYESRLF